MYPYPVFNDSIKFHYDIPNRTLSMPNFVFGPNASASSVSPDSSTSTFRPTGNAEYDERVRKRLAAKKRAEEQALKDLEESQLEEQKKDSVEACKQGLEQIKREKESIKANKKSDGSSTITSGVDVSAIEKKSTEDKALRWGKNAVVSLWNMGKGMLGFDDKGFNVGKFALNAGLAVAAAGLCCIPGVGLAMLAGGLIYGGYKMIDNGIKAYNASDKADELVDKIKAKQEKLAKADSDSKREKLEKELEKLQAEYIANEQKIDEAQQGTVSNGVIAVTSAIGGYKMINSTAGAVTGSGITGKVSAFGKNAKLCAQNEFGAWKSPTQLWSKTSKNFNNLIGNFIKKSDKKVYEENYLKEMNDISSRIKVIDNQLSTATGAKKAMLEAERNMLHQNRLDLCKLGYTKQATKADIDALKQNSWAKTSQQSLADGTYATQNSAGMYEVGNSGSQALTESQFQKFSQAMSETQAQHAKALDGLIKNHDDMMYSMANWKIINRNKDQARIETYLGGKVNVGKPKAGFVNITRKENWRIGNGNFGLTREQVAMNLDGSMGQTVGQWKSLWKVSKSTIPMTCRYMTHKSSNVLKARATEGWGISDPVTSNPFSGAQVLTAEQVKQTEKALKQKERTLNEINSKVSSAKTEEDIIVAKYYVQAYAIAQQQIEQSGETKGITMEDVEQIAAALAKNDQEQAKKETAQTQQVAQAQQQTTAPEQETATQQ